MTKTDYSDRAFQRQRGAWIKKVARGEILAPRATLR